MLVAPILSSAADILVDYLNGCKIRAGKILSIKGNPDNLSNYASKSRLSPSIIETLKDICQALEEIYPGMWDIQFDVSYNLKTHTNSYGSNHIREFTVFDGFYISTVYIVVYFPDITITNTLNHTHNIKDLFVRVPITVYREYDTSKLTFHTIQGTRSTLTVAELSNSYFHSHLKSRDLSDLSSDIVTDYDTFCTGEGEINMMKTMLNSGYDSSVLRLMLMTIKDVITWESREGVPHRRISDNIDKNYQYTRIGLHNLIDCYKLVERALLIRTEPPNFDWKFENGNYKLIDNEKLEDFLYEILGTYSIYNVFKDSNGNYYNRTTHSIVHKIGEHDIYVQFRGKKMYFKIIGENKKVVNNQRYYINPKVKEYVITKFEYKINFKKARESRVN